VFHGSNLATTNEMTNESPNKQAAKAIKTIRPEIGAKSSKSQSMTANMLNSPENI